MYDGKPLVIAGYPLQTEQTAGLAGIVYFTVVKILKMLLYVVG